MTTSKISTSYLFDRATERMTALQARAATTQAQMAESKQILSPSDAPDKAAAIQRLTGEISRQQSNTATLKAALSRYSAEETALSSSNEVLVRLKELGLQAANGTLGSNDRQAIVVEMKALRSELISLGNSRDDNGNYLFSGTKVKTPAFGEDINGRVTYQGDQTQTRIPAGVERTVAYSRSGTDVFARVLRKDAAGGETGSVGFFDSLDDMIGAIESGNTAGMSTGLNELDQMHDHINVSLAQSGSDQQVIQSQLDVLSQTSLRLKSTLSDVQDLDYTEAAARMNKELTALQAAMTSFAKIAGMSLFDHLR